MKGIRILSIAMGMALAVGCSKNLTTSRSVEPFDVFYDRFHTDYSFQRERVVFPLGGAYEGPEGEEQWSLGQWEPHKQKVTEITDPQYDTEIIRTDTEVIERVQEDGGGFYSERRFQLRDKQWYLVYYATVNL